MGMSKSAPFVFVEDALRRSPLFHPPDEGLFLNASLVRQVTLDPDAGIEAVVVDRVGVKVEPDRSNTHNTSVSNRAKRF